MTDTLSVAGQYMLEWESFRYPEGGTYLGPVDFAFNGPDRQFVSPALGFAPARRAVQAPSSTASGGLAARWSPEWLDGTLGFYYRNFSDKLPQTFITQVGPNSSRYNLIYADNIDLCGVSLAKNIGGISFGAEALVPPQHAAQQQGARHRARPAGGRRHQGPARRHLPRPGQRASASSRKTPLFDTASLVGGAHVGDAGRKVTSGQNLFFAEGFAPCTGKDKWDGCTTKNYIGARASSFTPTWFQVFPGVDLSAPITYACGLNGNAPTVFGGNEGNGNYSVGVGADIQQKYRVDLKYIDYVGHYKDNGTAVTAQNGFTTLLEDRGFVSLTFKTTF